MRFKKGDRVVYVGTYSAHMIGREGVVDSQDTPRNVKVIWDNGVQGVYGVYPENIKLNEVMVVERLIEKYEI